MGILLKFAQLIDGLNRLVGKSVIWLVLAATLISAANAIARKAFNVGSNAFLEIQWYLFSAVFLLGAGFTFLQNAHVRIDVLSSRLSQRTRAIIDVVGIIVFLLPMCFLVIDTVWPVVRQAYVSGEMSSNAGGLIRWPAYALIPAGFILLALQAVSELIKRIAFLLGKAPDPTQTDSHDQVHDAVDMVVPHDAPQTSTPAGGEVRK